MEKVSRLANQTNIIPAPRYDNGILLDNSALYAIFDAMDHFHVQEQLLHKLCVNLDIKLWIPAHTLFEFNSVRLRKLKTKKYISFIESHEAALNITYMDDTFMKRYSISDLPYQGRR